MKPRNRVPQWNPHGPRPTGIGGKPPGWRLVEDGRAPLGDRVLACLATYVRADGEVVHPTTADIAARLHIRAQSMERDELNHVLTSLRQRRLLKYEHDGPYGEICWRLAPDGWALARRLTTGTTGYERASAEDRSADRVARVRDGTVPERVDSRRP